MAAPDSGSRSAKLLRAAAAILVVCCSASSSAQAPDRAHADALARRATERLRALQREADQLAGEERTLLVELRRLEVEREMKAEEVTRLDADAATVAAELFETNGRIRALEAEQQRQQPALGARLAQIYKLGNGRYVRLLFGTDDLRNLGRTYRTVSALARLDQQRVIDHRQILERLRGARVSLEKRSADLAALQAEGRLAQTNLARAASARARLIGEIDSRRDLNARLAGELQAAQQKLQQALAAIAAGKPATVALPVKPFRGDLEWPVRGEVSARFGRGRSSRFGTAILRNGIEIAAPAGSPAHAVHDGLVAFAQPFTGFGNLVILDHGDQSYSLYGHLSSIAVVRGARLVRGQPVGAVGASPVGPPGLYFELRIDGKPVDPLQWLKTK